MLQNVQKGDVAYLYSSSPESAIRFKAEVVESQIPYSPAVDEGDEFAKSASNDIDYSDKLFFLVRPIADTNSQALKHEVMMNQKLMGKRPSTTKLSKEEFKSLRQYIEQHFDDAAPTEKPVAPAPAQKAKPKKQDKPKTKADRRPPFKFSMIGLKPGDELTFDSTGAKVIVASDNTIEYQGKEFTLNRFVVEYLPEEKRIPAGTYQGPKYFTYNGKALWQLRLEEEGKARGEINSFLE